MKLLQGPHWPSIAVIVLAVFIMLVLYHCLFHLGRKGR